MFFFSQLIVINAIKVKWWGLLFIGLPCMSARSTGVLLGARDHFPSMSARPAEYRL